MAWRSGEVGMDFEYDNKVGNIDTGENRSPFAVKAMENKAATLHRDFGSTFKMPPAASRKPTLNVPPLPQTPKMQAPVFREQINTDFSSAAESSPDAGNGADNEEMPDFKRLENVTTFRGSSPHRHGGKAGTPTKTPPVVKRLSWLAKLRPSRQHTELMRKTHKRKRREVEREDRTISVRHGADDPYNDRSSRPSSSDSDDGRGVKKKGGKGKEAGTVASVLSFIHEHPRLPTILAFYGQCLFSFFILGMLGWMIWGMYSAVLQQIEVEAEVLGQDALREIESCRKQYLDNRCDSDSIPPALQAFCADWDHCRSQDWRAKGRAKIGAHTFAQILNSFVEPLSYKLIVLVLAAMALLVMSPYTLFNPVRRATDMHLQQQQQQHQHQPQQSPAPFYPQTPSRQVQQEWANAGAFSQDFYTPQTMGRQWQRGGGGVGGGDWGSPSKRMDGRPRSPAKQIEYHGWS